MNKMRYCIREKCSREKATDVIVPVHGKYIAACRVIGLTFLVLARSPVRSFRGLGRFPRREQ